MRACVRVCPGSVPNTQNWWHLGWNKHPAHGAQLQRQRQLRLQCVKESAPMATGEGMWAARAPGCRARVSPRNKQTHHAGLTEPGGREMKRSREGKKTLVSPTTAGGYLTLQRWLKNYLAFREKLQFIPCWWRKAFLYRMPANTHRRNHRSLPSLWKNWLTQGSLRDVKTISWKAVSSVSPSLHQEMSLEPPAVATWQPPRGTWPGSWTEGPPSIPSPIKYFWWKCLIWI